VCVCVGVGVCVCVCPVAVDDGKDSQRVILVHWGKG